MKELNDIVKAYDLAQSAGKRTALATVVYVDGSSYRRAGARMLISEDGQLTGAISGGCLEGDALRKARLAMVKKKSMLITYDTTDEDDAKFGIGLGCNGIIQILIEPLLDECPVNPIQFFKTFLSKRKHAVLITVFNMEDRYQEQFGTCLLIEQNGQITGELDDPGLADEVLNDARQIFDGSNGGDKIYLYQDGYTCLVELLEPAVALVIAGAGNDAMPLIRIADVLGWSVTLADGRANYNTAERFPLAGTRVIASAEHVPARLTIDSRTVFMLMTHNYNYDLALLKELMLFNVPYIGVLGPKKRLVRMMEEITGVPANDENMPQHVYGPAGLDIGSENAEEIAVAIVAEIQAAIKKKDALPLKMKAHIHDRHQRITDQTIVNR